jgi:hypothetical protein
MGTKRPSATIVAFALIIASAGAACSERGQMSSSQSNSSGQSNAAGQNSATDQRNSTAQNEHNTAANNRTPITVTGCVQQASGMNNYVLTNVTGSQGSPEERAQGYRIEGGDVKEQLGKQVRVTGWIDPQRSQSSQNQSSSLNQNGSSSPTGTSGHAGTSSQNGSATQNGSSSQMSYDDFQQLHVENVEPVSNNCGNSSGSTSGK